MSWHDVRETYVVHKETQRFLDAMERRHGSNISIRRKVTPVVRRIFETDTPARRDLLDAIAMVYGYHVRAHELIDELKPDLGERFAA